MAWRIIDGARSGDARLRLRDDDARWHKVTLPGNGLEAVGQERRVVEIVGPREPREQG